MRRRKRRARLAAQATVRAFIIHNETSGHGRNIPKQTKHTVLTPHLAWTAWATALVVRAMSAVSSSLSAAAATAVVVTVDLIENVGQLA